MGSQSTSVGDAGGGTNDLSATSTASASTSAAAVALLDVRLRVCRARQAASHPADSSLMEHVHELALA
jgi:hypothetical protein